MGDQLIDNMSVDGVNAPLISNGIYQEVREISYFNGDKVDDLTPEEVRWFYKAETERKWTPFIGYDSLRIEWKYRACLRMSNSTINCENNSSDDNGDTNYSEDIGERPEHEGRVVVRGGVFEVDVVLKKCESIYWQGETFAIMRGTWFYDGSWIPLEEQLADKIEEEHLHNFRGMDISAVGPEDSKDVVKSLCLFECQLDWFGSLEVYLTPGATPYGLMRSVGKRFGFQKTGYRLQRGYSIDASITDKSPDITHLIFVIHGIGQKMETGRIIRNCVGLRDTVNCLKQKYFPELARSEHTLEFFPVEWRSSLVLDGGLIESVTPQTILNIRQMLNASFMDIMYYKSPLYREEILNGLTREMNRLYDMFTRRHPYFEANGGQVSVVAHSLGCVLIYDIVTKYTPARTAEEYFVQSVREQMDESDCSQFENKILGKVLDKHLQFLGSSSSIPTLNFKIENFFCLGSPLSVFLAMRNRPSVDRPMTLPDNLCSRLLNVFHPADPIAYRLEPLLCPQYASVAPVTINSYNANEKVAYWDHPLEPLPNQVREREAGVASLTNGTVTSANNVKGSSWSLWDLVKGKKSSMDQSQAMSELAASLLGLPERLDFVLREGSMESSYISAVTSHTAYWTNYDVAHFILEVLYPDATPSAGKNEVGRVA